MLKMENTKIYLLLFSWSLIREESFDRLQCKNCRVFVKEEFERFDSKELSKEFVGKGWLDLGHPDFFSWYNWSLLRKYDVMTNMCNLSILYKLPFPTTPGGFAHGFATPQVMDSQSILVVAKKLFPLVFFTALPFWRLKSFLSRARVTPT